MPSSRDVSISNHVGRRRRSSNGLNNYCSGSNSGSSGSGCGSSGSSSSSSSNKVRHHYPQHHNNLPQLANTNNNNKPPPPRSRNYEGGYDSHAASYGNYDAPSPHCRRPGSDGEHGRYATEGYIRSSVEYNNSNVVILPRTGERLRRNSDPDEEIYQTHHPNTNQQPLYNDDYRYNNSRQRRPPSRTPGGKYYSQNGDPMLRVSQASTIPAKGSGHRSSPQQHIDNQSSWDEEQSSIMPSTRQGSTAMNDNSCLSEFSSYCPSVKTASTAGSSTTSGSSTILIEEDVIRQGVIDISMLIATYLAGALSFVIGILLTLLSPVIKMIKLIVGDVRGILGDAGFIHELGSLWRVYRDLRTRSSGSTRSPSNRDGHSTASSSSYNPRYDQYSRNANYYDDESTVGGDDQSSVYTENSPQYIGGWRPRVNSSSVGSSQLGTGVGSATSNNSGTTSSNHTGNSSSRRTSSRSYPSLSQVQESSSYYHQDDRISSPQAQQQQQAPMSHGAPNMMYQGHQAQQHHPTTPSRSQQGPPSNSNSSGYYSHGGYQPARGRSYSASPVKQSQHRHCGPSSGISSHYSPQKNRRQRPGVV